MAGADQSWAGARGPVRKVIAPKRRVTENNQHRGDGVASVAIMAVEMGNFVVATMAKIVCAWRSDHSVSCADYTSRFFSSKTRRDKRRHWPARMAQQRKARAVVISGNIYIADYSVCFNQNLLTHVTSQNKCKLLLYNGEALENTYHLVYVMCGIVFDRAEAFIYNNKGVASASALAACCCLYAWPASGSINLGIAKVCMPPSQLARKRATYIV